MDVSTLVVKVKVFFSYCILFSELNYFKVYAIFRTSNLGCFPLFIYAANLIIINHGKESDRIQETIPLVAEWPSYVREFVVSGSY